MGKSLNGKELGTGITQRKDGKYQARFVNRFGKRVTLYADTVTEIKKKLRTAQGEDDRKENIIDSNMTLDQWYETWITTYKTNLKLSTLGTYYDQYEKVKNDIGNVAISKINTIMVQNSLNTIQGDCTRNKVKKLLTSMFKDAISAELVNKNPLEPIKVKKKKTSERRFLSSQEKSIFLEESKSTSQHNIFVVAFGTGMRASELIGLTFDDIDLDRNVLYVKRNLNNIKTNGKYQFYLSTPKTDSGIRMIPFGQDVHDAIVEQKELNLKLKNEFKQFGDLVFITRGNAPYTKSVIDACILRVVKRINARHKDSDFKRFSLHCIRHTYATLRIEHGMQPKVLQKILGHSSLRMTMDLYCHVDTDHIINEVMKCENMSLNPNGV